MKKIFLLLVVSIMITTISVAQQMERMDSQNRIICYAAEHSAGTKIFRRSNTPYGQSPFSVNSNSATTQTGATIEVVYNGFSEEAKAAFQMAVDIWSELLSSSVVIRVNATWQELDEGTLGSATWNTAYRNFEGAKELNVWYPVALAEKMAGTELNSPSDPDIVANFNKEAPWYLGLDGNTGPGEFDLVSVVLHELGHGLGFIDSFNVTESNGNGTFGIQDFPFIFDLSVENNSGESLIDFGSGTIDLGNALTSNFVFFNSPTAAVNNGSLPRLYAPSTWSNGSSIAHLNEGTYPSGNTNSLMTPQIAPNEVMQDPGQIVLDMFGDMGWEYTFIEHTNRPNSEEIQADSYSVTATINSDVGYKDDGVFLYYSTDGFANDTTMVQMTATGNENEFTAEITSVQTEGQVYTYFFTVEDVKDREFSNPSLLIPERYFSFSTNPDNNAPIITHNPPNFIRTSDANLNLSAIISDFLPVNVTLEYTVNNGNIQTLSFNVTDESTSTYEAQLDLTSFNLVDGNTLDYRIVATDISSNANSSTFPETGFTEISVIAAAEPAPFYFNDFNNVEESAGDFFDSNNFSIKEEGGFSNGALHSDHPYSDGTDSNGESNYIVELNTPIIVNEGEAKMSFDEVALIEPGEANSVFGDDGFYDYVIVEGSKDGGENWVPLVDGYDSRITGSWLTRYNSSITDNNSTAVGVESLYRKREIDILSTGEFLPGDEVLFRFRLFADEAANGWGWAIDNLNIQLDNEAPNVEHNHVNFLKASENLVLNANVMDNFDVDSVGVLILVNDVEQEPLTMSLVSGTSYQALIDATSLSVGDVIKYRIAAFDTKEPEANATYLPSESEFFEVPIISFNAAQETYSNDFNSATDDFVGNFFSVETLTGFSDGAIHSTHPYPFAFGLNDRSAFTYMLKTPITVSSSIPYVTYDEVLLIESISDYAALEGSKDNGDTWFEIDSYDTNEEPDWAPVFESGGDGTSSLFKKRIIKLTDSPQISVGDEVILRFRLDRKSTRSGWGWAIDNLEVQTEIVASIENQLLIDLVSVYPNPITNNQLNIQLVHGNSKTLDYSIVTINGEEQLVGNNIPLDDNQSTKIDVSNLPAGLFLLKVLHNDKYEVHKVLKLDR